MCDVHLVMPLRHHDDRTAAACQSMVSVHHTLDVLSIERKPRAATYYVKSRGEIG